MKSNNIGKITRNSILLTGATGLIGSYFLKTLLENNNTVFSIVRGKNRLSSSKRVQRILQFWDGAFESNVLRRNTVINADLTGLDLDQLKKIFSKIKIDIIIHCAANTNLHAPLGELIRVNVLSLQNILDFGEFLHKKGTSVRIVYLSTAYVCGRYRGRFAENDFDLSQEFNTDYEISKFEAEKLVYEFRKKDLWIDIFRPSLVVGESATGKTPVFQSLLQAVQLLSKEIFDIFPAKNVPANIVNVDEAVLAMLTIIKDVKKRSQNYNIFSLEPSCFEDFITISSQYLNYKMPKLVEYDQLQRDSLTEIQRRLLDNTIYAFNPYVSLDANFTNKILNELGFFYSRIDEKMILRLLKFATSVNFKSYDS